jgi:PAS domain S-box-containing protein
MKKKTSAHVNAQGRSMKSATAERKQERVPLSASEKTYRTLFEGMLQGAFFQAADGRLLDVNPRALKILGLTRQEFLSRTAKSPSWTLIREDGSSVPEEEHPLQVVLRTGLPETDKIFGVFNNLTNAYVWVIVNAIPQFRPGECTPYQVYVTLHDITERKKDEAALRQSEERYRMLTETSPDAIMTVNAQGHIVSWNRGAEKIYGFTADHILGKDVFRIIPERFRPRQSKLITMMASSRNPSVLSAPREIFGRRKDGSEFCAEATFNMFWANDEPFFTTIVRDISERKQIEKRLHESEELFRLSFENAPIGIFIIDKDGVMIQANMFCEQCFGRGRDELMQQGFTMFLHPEDREKCIKMFAADSEGFRQLTLVENRYFAADGRTIYTKQHIQGIFDAQGNRVSIIVLTEDITTAKQLILMNNAVINKLKDVYSQLNEFCGMLPENQKFLTAKSLSDYELSPMEKKIASLMFHGSPNKAIAANLRISENTVKHHITNIYNKFNVKNRLEFSSSIRTNRIFI